MVISDPEIQNWFAYFVCAYYFHWTTAEVDATDARIIEALMYALPIWLKKISEVPKV